MLIVEGDCCSWEDREGEHYCGFGCWMCEEPIWCSLFSTHIPEPSRSSAKRLPECMRRFPNGIWVTGEG